MLPTEQLTLDGLVARFGSRALRPSASSNVCTLYLVFKEPRTLTFRHFPRGRVIQFLGLCPGPFWGNLSNLRRLPFPVNPFFACIGEKSLEGLARAARCSRPRTSRKSRPPNVGDRPESMSTPSLWSQSRRPRRSRRPFRHLDSDCPAPEPSSPAPRGSLTATSLIVMPPCLISRNASLFDFARPAITTSSVFARPAPIFAALTDRRRRDLLQRLSRHRAAKRAAPRRSAPARAPSAPCTVPRHLVGEPPLRRARRRIVLHARLERVDLRRDRAT